MGNASRFQRGSGQSADMHRCPQGVPVIVAGGLAPAGVRFGGVQSQDEQERGTLLAIEEG